MFEPLAASFAVVALAEIGDKTMLLALVLAARFGKPLQIVLGILLATLANHFVAAWLGTQAAAFLDGQAFRIAVALGFIAMGLWTLIPDKFEEEDKPRSRYGAFLTTLVAFFLVEIGDKTQIATIALGARYHDALLVTIGTTAGMLAANIPAVLLGEALLRKISLSAIRYAAAALFVVLGIIMLAQALGAF